MLDEITERMRRSLIGGSDAPVCCGVPTRRTAFDLWAEKTGRIGRAFKGNKATELGNALEPSLVQFVGDSIGEPVSTDIMIVHRDEIRGANLDGLMTTGREPGSIEAKTSGLLWRSERSDEWGDPRDGADGVPDDVLIQVHHGFDLLDQEYPGIDLAHVIALVGGRGLLHYRVKRNERLVSAIRDAVYRFWEEHIKTNRAPDHVGPSDEVARALIRVPNKVVSMSRDTVERWQAARQARLDAEKIEEALESEVLRELDDAEFGECSAGRVSFVEIERAGYTVKPTKYRRLTFKRGKRLKPCPENAIAPGDEELNRAIENSSGGNIAGRIGNK